MDPDQEDEDDDAGSLNDFIVDDEDEKMLDSARGPWRRGEQRAACMQRAFFFINFYELLFVLSFKIYIYPISPWVFVYELSVFSLQPLPFS